MNNNSGSSCGVVSRWPINLLLTMAASFSLKIVLIVTLPQPGSEMMPAAL